MVGLGGRSVFDRLGGLSSFPSGFCARSGDDICRSLRCLFDGIPRADARLLAMEELISRGGTCTG